MRNISFMLTTAQVRARTKTVTRRLGWASLKPGERLQACVKCQGLKPGEKLEKICVIKVLSVRREPLNALIGGMYTDRMAKRECIAEGFPEMSPRQFVRFFCTEMGVSLRQTITRIEFTYEN